MMSRRVGLFVIGYLTATLFCSAVVAMYVQGRGWRVESLQFFVSAIGTFCLLPALAAIALIARRKLNPLKCILVSSVATALVGAPLAVWLGWYLVFGESVIQAVTFIVISVLSGLISGVIFWFFLFRLNEIGRSSR